MGRRGKTQPFIVTQPKTSIEPKHAGAVAVAVAVYTPCPAHKIPQTLITNRSYQIKENTPGRDAATLWQLAGLQPFATSTLPAPTMKALLGYRCLSPIPRVGTPRTARRRCGPWTQATRRCEW